MLISTGQARLAEGFLLQKQLRYGRSGRLALELTYDTRTSPPMLILAHRAALHKASSFSPSASCYSVIHRRLFEIRLSLPPRTRAPILQGNINSSTADSCILVVGVFPLSGSFAGSLQTTFKFVLEDEQRFVDEQTTEWREIAFVRLLEQSPGQLTRLV